MKSVAIIGGTGIGDRLAALGGETFHLPTEYGLFRAKKLHRDGQDIFLLQRHSAGHKNPPHRVPYHAMAIGAKMLGASCVLSTAAVGSVRADWGPGTFAVCSDFLDMTFRRVTLFDRKVVHRDFTDPFSPDGRRALLDACAKFEVEAKETACYVGGDGPRYETPQEIQMYRGLGGDVVGMTASSEAILMREAQVPYACLAIVTNLGCGLGTEELDHQEVVDLMEQRGEVATKILLEAARTLG